ncbi:MAG TPA: hypothetical protein VER58_00615 [Thermoanaerobaculia bacterium]|nr:hypothetical protein [Thermoanaerobaculia bacterium]
MKLFGKFVGFVAVIVALVFAKKHFLDKPSPDAMASEANSAGASAPKLAIQPGSIPQPQSQSQQGSQPAAPAVDENAVASLVHKFFGGGQPEDKAKVRIRVFMQTWKEGGTSLNDAEQAAACMWSRGKMFIPDRDEIQDAYNGFNSFRKAKDLYTTINEYAIADTISRGHDEGHGDYSEFQVTINGKTHLMGVPDKANPIFWIR